MLFKQSIVRLSVVVVTLVLAGLTAGCEQARRDIAAAVSPATAQDVLKNVRQKIADGNFKAGREEGEAFLDGNSDNTGLLAWELSKACVQLGDNEQGIHFVERAIRARAVSGIDLMSEPMLEPVRSDPRLVALAAGLAPAPGAAGSAGTEPRGRAPASPAQPAQPSQPAAASIGANGVAASAGDVSVSLPD